MSPVQKMLAQAAKIPAMPASVARLFAMAQDSRSTAADVERLLRSDVALSANLLRLANSPLAGRSRRISDLRSAVTMLGLRRVCEIAASAHLLRVISRPLYGYNMTPLSFWRHCSAVGLLAENLAKQLRLENTSLAFTCGMLHDIGKLAISVACEAEGIELRVPYELSDQQFIESERQAFNTDHVEVGDALARQWHLPKEIVAAARWHHAPEACPDEHLRPIVAVVHVSDFMAHAFGYGTDAGELSRVVSAQACHDLGVTVQALEVVASETLEAIQGAVSLFEGSGGEAWV